MGRQIGGQAWKRRKPTSPRGALEVPPRLAAVR